MNINPQIFRGYDIRGISDVDLTEKVYYTLGCAYAYFLAKRRINLVPVGHDNRLKSIPFKDAFIRGLNDSGLTTVDLGYSLSQIIYFAGYQFKTKAGAMITASHNPKEYNGLKLSVGYSETMITKEVQELKTICQSSQFINPVIKGNNQAINIFPQYQAEILKYFQIKKPWKIVVDTCNTTSGLFYPSLLRQAGCQVIEQNTKLDSNFPLGSPDPTDKVVLDRLSIGVRAAKADLGFAYDADGDRLAVVDDQGQVLWMDNIVSLFAIDILDYLPGSPIVFNTLCSRQVTETIEKHQGKPVMWLTGHSFIKEKIKIERSPFGGELSGHLFFTDNFYGHDDAAYASLRLLAFLERKNFTLNQAVSQLPKYLSSPEIKLGLGDDIKFDFVEKTLKPELQKLMPAAVFTTIDGVRADLPDQMVIFRASNNGPYLVIKFEAKNDSEYQNLKAQIKNLLSSHPEIDWNKNTNKQAFD